MGQRRDCIGKCQAVSGNEAMPSESETVCAGSRGSFVWKRDRCCLKTVRSQTNAGIQTARERFVGSLCDPTSQKRDVGHSNIWLRKPLVSYRMIALRFRQTRLTRHSLPHASYSPGLFARE